MKKAFIIRINQNEGVYEGVSKRDIKNFFLKDTEGQGEVISFEFVLFNNCNSFDDYVEMIVSKKADYLVFEFTSVNYKFINKLVEDKRIIEKKAVKIYLSELIDYAIKITNTGVIGIKKLEDLKEVIFRNNFWETDNFIWEKIKRKYDSVEKPQSDLYVQRMNNGFNLMFTGKYPNDFCVSRAQHILVENQKILDEIDIDNLMDVNSAVFVETKDSEKLKAKYKDSYIHFHTINENEISFDFSKEKEFINIIGYKEFSELLPGIDKKVNRIEMKTYEDFFAFKNKVLQFKINGTIDNPFFILRNECRWSNRCTLSYGKRFKIDNLGEINPCFDGKDTLCHINWDSYKKNVEISKRIQLCNIKRNCRGCVSKDFCTKCSLLPEWLEEKEYCDFMKANCCISEFFNCKNLLMLLVQYSKIFQNINYADVIFSHSMKAFALPEKYFRGRVDDSNNYLFMFQGDFYCFNPLNNKMLKVQKGSVLIIEAIKQGYSEVEIGEIISEVYGSKFSQEEIYKSVNYVKNVVL